MNEIRKRESLPESVPPLPVWNFPQVLEPDPSHDPGTTPCAECGETISPSDEQFAFLKGDTYRFYHAWCKPQPEL